MTDDEYDALSDIEKVEYLFPQLANGTGYEVKSEATIVYNCLSWALGIDWTRYDPEPYCAGYYWFPGVEREWSLTAIAKIFINHGYQHCDNSDLEKGFEKIVFYVNKEGEPKHFARQLEDGRWTSKLGDLNDIAHDKLESLEIADYGNVQLVMKRKRQNPQAQQGIRDLPPCN